MSKILDGKKLRDQLVPQLIKKIRKTAYKPKLIIPQIGNLKESNSYIKKKKTFGRKLGALVVHKQYPENVSEKNVISDISMYNKAKLGSKHFWIRSNLSNLWSQFLDTVMFTFVAFLSVYPFPTLVSIVLTWWLYKVTMGFLYTPLSYVGIYLLKDKAEIHE